MTQLSALLEAITPREVTVPDDLEIRDIAYDSRRVGPGSLFVAVPTVGGAGDSGGHTFLSTARDMGAAAAVIQDGPAPEGLPYVRVADARAALADLAASFYRYPSRELALLAVTGTDGKTTTTYLLEQILAGSGLRTGLIGTVEVKVGGVGRGNPERMTTPESLDLQRLLREMVDAGVTHVALEASSHALALDRMRGCVLASCALTNVTADHIEFHGSWNAYFAAKARLFTTIPRSGPAVLNQDDEHFADLAALLPEPPLTYGFASEAQVSATNLRVEMEGTSFSLTTGSGRVETRVGLPGRFNVSNGLAAASLALAVGIPLSEVGRGLAAAQPPPGRMQRVSDGQGFEVIVDYAHTMNAFTAVLAGLRDSRGGRVIAVFGAAGNRDRGKRPLLAHIAKAYTDFFVITNEDPFDEDAASIIEEVAAGADPAEEGQRFLRIPDREAAIRAAVGWARPGDTVVILGKGHEQSIVEAGRKQPWSDAEVARRAIEEQS